MDLKKKIRKEKYNLIVDSLGWLAFTIAWMMTTINAINKMSTIEGIVSAILSLTFFIGMMFFLAEVNKDKSRLMQLRLKEKGICEHNEECKSYPEKCKTCGNNTSELDMYYDINTEE